jgi:hypothetical protein
MQRLFKEELEPTDDDGHGVTGVMFDILDEEKVLALGPERRERVLHPNWGGED